MIRGTARTERLAARTHVNQMLKTFHVCQSGCSWSNASFTKMWKAIMPYEASRASVKCEIHPATLPTLRHMVPVHRGVTRLGHYVVQRAHILTFSPWPLKPF